MGRVGRRAMAEIKDPTMISGAYQCHIGYLLASRAEVRLRICRWGKQAPLRIYQAMQGPGEAGIIWDGKDSRGRQTGTGVYTCHVEQWIDGHWIRIADIT